MAQVLVLLIYGYCAIGLLFAVWFVVRGVNKVDPGMHAVHWAVRALIFPGSLLLWPVLLKKYLKAK